MTCAEVKLMLSAYQDHEVDERTGSEIKRHLEGCDSCRQEWHQLQHVWQQIQALPEVEPEANFSQQVMGKIRQKKKQRFPLLPSMVYSFVFLLFFVVGFMIFSINGGGRHSPAETGISKLLVESQNLNLINVQDPTINLIAYRGNHHGR